MVVFVLKRDSWFVNRDSGRKGKMLFYWFDWLEEAVFVERVRNKRACSCDVFVSVIEIPVRD